MAKLTTARRRALEIVAEHSPIRAREFAEKMWPDSPAWQISYNCGPSGSTRGRGIVMSGGSYLGKLAKADLVRGRHRFGPNERYWFQGYVLTSAGREALAQDQDTEKEGKS